MKQRSTGPALGGVTMRWSGREKKLRAYIRNSYGVIRSGDAYANALFNEYNGSVMTAFPSLTDNEINAILRYIERR